MTTTVTVGVFSPPVLLEIARATGELAARDLEVRTEAVTSSPGQFRSLLDGTYDAALTSPDNVLAYRFSPTNPLGGTLDVRIVSAVDRGLGLGLYTAPGPPGTPGRTRHDLRGARLGVDVPNSGFAVAMYALLQRLGLRREDVEVLALGSTPRRLQALLAGDCDATMLNAGNELVAEQAGCVRLAGVDEVARPYLGTVLAVAGPPVEPVVELAEALRLIGDEVLAGGLTEQARRVVVALFDTDEQLAARYVDRLRDRDHGLVPGGIVDRASLTTLVELRRTWLPEPDGAGGDALDAALTPAGGVLAGP